MNKIHSTALLKLEMSELQFYSLSIVFVFVSIEKSLEILKILMEFLCMIVQHF